MSSLPARMEKIKLKMKVLDCSQDFSHYMGIFPDAQGQLTLQSTVRSGQISNSSKTLWLFSLPAKMKKIRSKIEGLECSHYTSIIQTCKGVGGGIWPKFELIQAFLHVLLTCKNEVDQIKNEGARVFTRFLPL